ncbi:MAG: LCP family protein [Chloroflexi bacterium]|nr:LCP family protein [Chloroflexota bacterium]
MQQPKYQHTPHLYTSLPTPFHHRQRRRQRLGCILGCALLILAPLGCISAFLLGYVLFPPAPLDLVILGVDARPGQGYLTRTDSVMVLNITPAEGKVSLLSIPRDVFITVPGYGEQRINTINVLGEQETPGSGGPALVKTSLQASFGISVERFVRLDFDGFIALIDALGGIEIDVPKQIVDYEYPAPGGGIITIEFQPGRQHMDGERALQYARTRHQDDDYRRAERQQQVIDAVVKRLSDPRGAVRWPQVVAAVWSHTDTDLNAWDMLKVAPALLVGWPGRDTRVIDRPDLVGTSAGYAIPDYEQLLPWMSERFD